jgi:hypothetical protein
VCISDEVSTKKQRLSDVTTIIDAPESRIASNCKCCCCVHCGVIIQYADGLPHPEADSSPPADALQACECEFREVLDDLCK